MRNLKKLFAVIMIVAMIASIMVPAYAADYEKEAQTLKSLGLFKGYSDTDLGLGDDLTREQGLTLMIRARGLEAEVEAMSQEEIAAQLTKVVDLDTVTDWAKPYVAYAVKNGLTKGIDTNIAPNVEFAGQLPLSGKEFINFMLYSMGYPDEWSKDTVLTKAAEIGMLSAGKAVEFGTTVVLKRDAAAGIISSAMTGITASGVTLAQALVDAGAVSAEAMAEAGYFEPTPVPTEAPVELAVTDYSADNLKEITLVFNKPLNKDTVKKDNIKIKKGGVTFTEYGVSLKDDQQTVVIRADKGKHFDNQVEYALTLKGIKDTEGLAIKETTINVKPFDATLPEITAIKITGPKSLELTFSEPIEDAGTGRSVTLKSGTTTVGVKTQFEGYDSNTIKVTLLSSLVDGKTYTISVKGFLDYAGYQMINYTEDFAYAADKSEITATVEKAEQTYVVVKFNKPVTGLTNKFFYHTFSAWEAVAIYSDSDMKTPVTGAVDKVWVVFVDDNTKYPIPEGDVKLVIRDKVGSAKIKDNWGNEFLGAELTISVTADKTPPSVAELKKKSETALTVKFSEDVKFTKDNIEILNADGSALSGLNITVEAVSGKEYTVNFGTNLSGKSILVNIKNVEDKALSPNKLALHSEVIEITDSTKPEVKNVTYKEVTGGERALFVFFSESVDDTALNRDNYYYVVGDTWTKFSNSPEFYDGNKVVRIELTAAELTKVTTTGTKIVVKDIKDLAGNALVVQEFSAIKKYDDTANKPKLSEINATATNKVDLVFDQFLTDIDTSIFEVNGKEPAGVEISENSKGNTIITLTTQDDRKFSHDLIDTGLGYTIQVVINLDQTKTQLSNIFGVNADLTTMPAINDKIKPEIKTATTIDANGDGKLDNILVEFTENINYIYIAPAAFTVDGFTVEDAYPTTDVTAVTQAVYNSRGVVVNGPTKFALIRVKQKDVDTVITPKVKVVTTIKDTEGNEYDLSKDAVTSVDGIAPVVATKLPKAGEITANTTHTLVFSEALHEDSRKADAVMKTVGEAYGKTGTAKVELAWGSDNKTLTVTITADATNKVTLGNISTVTVKDLKGNQSGNLTIQSAN